LGAALDAVLAKYVPAGADEYGPEVALVVTATMIIAPRLQHSQGERGSDAGA